MTTLLTPNLVLTAALPVLSDRRKTLLQCLYSFWLRKLSWRTQLSFPSLSVGKVQSWIAKAEAERFPESLTPLPPFPQPPPPWLEQGWHGRWDSNVGVGGPTIAGPLGLLRTTRSQVPALRGLRWQQHSSSRGGNITSLIWRMEPLISDRSI